MKTRTLLMSTCVCLLSTPLAQAANRTWDAGAGTTDWFTAQNWSADAMPIVGDTALIDMASGVTVAAPGAAATQVQIGTTNGGVGNMTVSAGGGIDALSFVGNAAGSTGSLTINAGTWTSAGETRVGNNGNGTLLLQNGGTLQTGTTATVGFAAASVSTATVTDASSQWNTTGTLYVGRLGSGTLTVQNGGAVTNASGSIGDAVGATGVATVTGAGSTWTQSGASFTVGSNGSGTLNIQNGGVVENVNGRLGLNAGSTGVATVNGPGSTWTNTGTVLVGSSGDGTLNVQNGGAVSNTNGTVGSVAGSTGAVTVTGAGSTWASTGNIVVGSSGAGTLNVQNGGAVSNVAGTIGSVAGSTGTVTVTGAGSTWTNTTLTIASNGDGTLNVQGGGRINSTSGRIGLNAGTGIATIDGTGSIWVNSGNVTIGSNGPGTINIQNGGTVENMNGTLGVNVAGSGTVMVTGAGSTWTSDTLNIGNAGTGALTLTNGGAVSSTSNTIIGNVAGGTGTATVDGVGSSLQSSASLYVGNAGTGTLTLTNGGTASSTINTIIADDAGSNGTATVDGAGSSLATSATMTVGNLGTGTLTIQNGAFASALRVDIASSTNSIGNATVTGNGSVWNTENISVGRGIGAVGTLSIQNQGRVISNREGSIGLIAGSTGTTTIDGAGSYWSTIDYFNVGREGDGTLTIQNGATSGHDTLGIGYLTGGTGLATVTGANSALNIAGDISIGGGVETISGNCACGTGALVVSNGGSVTTGNGSYILSDSGALSRTGTSTVYIANLAGSTGTLSIGADALSAAAAAGTVNADSIVFGLGTGEIVFNHTDLNYMFDADISGNGTLNFLSGTTKLSGDNTGFTGTILGAADIAVTSGTTNIDSNSSAFAGTTDVMGGILRVNGSLGGDTTISGTGRLQGNATLVNLIVDNGGTAAPGNSIGTVNVVNVTFNPGSTYEVEVNSAGQSDLIDATGTATINGGTVLVLPFPDYRLDQPYTIITAAGGVAGTFDDVSDNFLFLDAGLTYDANNVYVTLVQSGPTLESVGRTRNQRAVARVIDSGEVTNAGVVALVGSQTNEDLWQGLDALSGEIHASVSGALMKAQSLLQHAGVRAERRISGGGHMWLKPFGHFGDVDHTSNTAALDERTYGVLAGIEKDFDDTANIGFGFGVSRTSVDADARGSKADSNNYHALLYVEKDLGNGLTFDGGTSYTFHRIGTERHVAFGSFNDESDADYNAHTGQIYTGLSHRFQINEQAELKPYIQGSFLYQRSSRFYESGEAGLTGNGEGSGVGFADIGIKTQYDLATKHESLTINTDVGYRRTVGTDDPSRDLAFNGGGNHFSIEGAPIGKNALILGAGLTTDLRPAMDFTIGYHGVMSRDSKAHEISARVSVAF